MDVKGTLIPIGGAEDRGGSEQPEAVQKFKEHGILRHVVDEAGGPAANIVIVPTASGIPVEVADSYLKAFDILGCKNVHVADIRTRAQSRSAETLKLFKQADAVMFSGGNQSKISRFILGTALQKLLLERYQKERFVVAGTSAGAMAMSHEMVSGGSSQESLIKGAVKMRRGLDFISGMVIDTHFVKRGRFGRLAEAMAIHPHLLGIGLAEDTGIIIKKGMEFTVIGSGMVILFDPSNLTHNKHADLPVGTPISMSNLAVHILANNDHFIIADRKIEIATHWEGRV